MNAGSGVRRITVGLMALASPLAAQESAPKTTWLVGGELAGLRASNPHGGARGLGGTVALDRTLNRFVTLRRPVLELTGQSTLALLLAF